MKTPNEIPASTAILYMRVTGLTVGDAHWPVTGRGEFMLALPAIPLPAPPGNGREFVESTATFTFTPDADQAELVQRLWARTSAALEAASSLWACGCTLYDDRPVSVVLTGYALDVCTPSEMRWSATHLPDNPPVVRFGVLP